MKPGSAMTLERTRRLTFATKLEWVMKLVGIGVAILTDPPIPLA
jgi:hypothetical protein